MKTERTCRLHHLGLVEYRRARDYQKKLARLRTRDDVPDSLILLEHPPTYTFGFTWDEKHFLVPPERIRRSCAAVHRADRGGSVTFHGPGQLIGYPVLKLAKGLAETARYIRNLEEMLIRALRTFGINGRRLSERAGKRPCTGVWVENEKVAAIGIKVDVHCVTHHGFALNVNTDLGYFEKIVPCGLRGKTVTSMARILGYKLPMEVVANGVAHAFEDIFEVKLVEDSETKARKTSMDPRSNAPGKDIRTSEKPDTKTRAQHGL